ncbi:MAG: Fe-S cluster assembly protein SufD [Pirellulales bacterium]|nr:Fe-S cluster assembly protein SufD [Pirellulales bacterium]
MPQTETATGFTPETFEAFLASRDEPTWLTEQRRAAFAAFGELPQPHSGMEEWRRTDIRLLRLDKYAPALERPAVDSLPAALLTSGGSTSSIDEDLLDQTAPLVEQLTGVGDTPAETRLALAGQTAALNSHSISSQLIEEHAKQGVIFGSLDQVVTQHPDLVQKYLFTRAGDLRYDRFAALHAAFWSGGTILYVPQGVRIEQPLYIQSSITPGSADFGHTLVVLEEGAEATLLAELSGGEEAGGLHCGGVEIIVGRGAFLRYVNLQNWDNTVWHFAHHKALVEADARLQWTVGALGSKVSKVNQHVALVGPGANAQVNGVMFAEGRQHLDYHTLQHHEAKSCRSDLLYKGGLQDQSRMVWRGMIKVDPGADKTDGYQRNDNLMLSDDARADSIPGLEIEADDVICTHGATTGRVDDEQIFYLQARGLTRNEATRVIVAGFFQQVFDRITIPSVREALGHAIRRRIREYE